MRKQPTLGGGGISGVGMKFQVSPLRHCDVYRAAVRAFRTKLCLRVMPCDAWSSNNLDFRAAYPYVTPSPGKKVILVHFEHHAVASPYRSSHAIYVRESASAGATRTRRGPDDASHPVALVSGHFDGAGMMVDADVSREAAQSEASISRLLSASASRYIHIHFARPVAMRRKVFRALSQYGDARSMTLGVRSRAAGSPC